MKKLFLFAAGCAIALSSCTKSDMMNALQEQSIDYSALPAQVTEYVDTNYPDTYIDEATLVSNHPEITYIVDLETSESLAFKGSGQFFGNGELYRDGGVLDDANGHPHGGGGCHGPGGQGLGGHGHGGHIPKDSLATAITDYLAANYADYNYHGGHIDSLCQFEGALISIALKKQGQPPVRLFFNQNGEYVMSVARANYADTPQAIQDYIVTNYAGYNVKPKVAKYTLADGTVQYTVFIGLQGDRKRLTFNADGALLCEQ